MSCLRIWEADCGLLDAVLALSFDAGELSNCCRSAGLDVPRCGVHDRAALVGTIHRACHAETPLALLIEHRLNLIHSQAIAMLERDGLADLRHTLLHSDLRRVDQLAGVLWALTTCADPEADELRTAARALITMTGLQLLAARRTEVA